MKERLDAEKIQHIARGFSRARILLTGAELGIFDVLAAAPKTSEEVCLELGSDPRATTILLDALAAMDLLTKKDGRYRTNTEAAPLLTEGSPDSVLPGLLHSAHLWKTWSSLTEVVLSGGPSENREWDRGDTVRAFIGAMHVRALRDAPELVRAVGPGAARKLIDVAGGSGSYTIAFLRSVPGMTATLFDLPDVIPLARERLSEEGLLDRVDLAAGDYNTESLPGGHDLALLSAVIHQNSHEQNVALYRNVHRSLVPGGRIVVRDYAMAGDRTHPPSGALFAVNMLLNTTGGNSYTFDEIRDGLEEAGFERVRLIQEKEMSSLVEGYKP